MSYADGLLSTGERITYRNKQHPFVAIWGARYAVLAIVIAAVLLWVGSNMDPNGAVGTLKTTLGLVALILFIGGIAVAIWNGLRYLNQEYVLTNRRVIQVEGVLNRNSTDSALEKINDAVLSQSIFGRMFDFGDLTILTASEAGIDKMRMLRSPIAFKKAMLDAKHEFEVGMEREGWAPGPPIRAGSGAPTGATSGGAGPAGAPTAQGTAAAPVAAAPATPAPRADPAEVTRTLASLADLRDRGAITPDEYEQKKADLLSRL
jgi:Bacterial PH domain/Short C-terminal domain